MSDLTTSKYLKIFVDSGESPEAFAKSLEKLSGLTLETTDDGDNLYKYSDHEHRWFTVGYHPFENDGDLHFEEYLYCIEIGIFDVYDWQERQQMLIEFARNLFDKLKASQKYHLLLVDNLQIKLDEFIPIHQMS